MLGNVVAAAKSTIVEGDGGLHPTGRGCGTDGE
jgi:hypothetical protein